MTEIRIPHRHRSDPVSSVGELARHLESPDEERILRQLVLDAAGAGLSTVGALLDQIDRLAPTERRALLDRARASAGLPRVTYRRGGQDERAPLALRRARAPRWRA